MSATPAQPNGTAAATTPAGPFVHDCNWWPPGTWGSFGYHGEWACREHWPILKTKQAAAARGKPQG